MESQKKLTMDEETLFIKWLIDRVSHDFIKGRLILWTYPDLSRPEKNSNGTRWYNFETLTQTDGFRRAVVESAHVVQSVHQIARWEAKLLN